MFFDNNENTRLLLEGYAGEHAFCRDCKEYETCNHKGQKILRTSRLILEYLYAGETKVWDGSLWDQPDWFLELLSIAQKVLNGNRKSKNKSNKR